MNASPNGLAGPALRPVPDRGRCNRAGGDAHFVRRHCRRHGAWLHAARHRHHAAGRSVSGSASAESAAPLSGSRRCGCSPCSRSRRPSPYLRSQPRASASRCHPLPRSDRKPRDTGSAADRNRAVRTGTLGGGGTALRQGAGLAGADLAWSMVLTWSFSIIC